MRLNMIHVWAKQGLALDLVVARADPAMIDALPESVRIFEIARRSPLLFPWALARYFLKHRPSHVLAAGYDAVAACVLLLRIVERRVPLVISIHSHTSVALRGKSGIWARVKDRVVYSALRGGRLRARGIIAVSEGVANDLVKIIGELPCNKLYTVPNPVVTQTTYALSQAPLDPALDTGGRPWIVFVGRLVPEKGVARLLEAYAGIAARSGVDLVVVGDGPDRKALMRQARGSGLQDRVHFVGEQKNPFPWMREARLLVLPSSFEGFGNVLVEAMLCGTQVVASDCPSGPREILADGAFGQLVPVGAVAPLAEAISRSLSGEFRVPPALLRNRAAEFTAEIAAERYLAIIRGEQAAP